MKPKIIIGMGIIIAALVFLIIGGFKETAVYYLTIPEVHAQESKYMGQGVRVSGYVIPESIDWDPGKIELAFTMQESGDSMRVFYKNVMPDQLAEAQQVIVEGKLDPQGTLQAERIMLKCPSKYEAKKEKQNSSLSSM